MNIIILTQCLDFNFGLDQNHNVNDLIYCAPLAVKGLQSINNINLITIIFSSFCFHTH